ncbi:hypothetical protein STRAU_4892 [Streptomyces aurantiacus JA 4570]|uniref:Uncharacterized protein n=1 Tax=Streptomyces aurantiacus JA 4570 TaxID=1286094 RepID=S3ZUC5_9ACTN|nr:hypothetical protein STRAU_4892 [Streptomyces aurantiacus JA 4570]
MSGDKVKKYPNLAAIPTGAWQRSVFGGRLRGLPMPAPTTPNIAMLHRADLFAEQNVEPPGTAREFFDLCKELNAPRAGGGPAATCRGRRSASSGCCPRTGRPTGSSSTASSSTAARPTSTWKP